MEDHQDGNYLVVEGGDGVGKTTQIALLKEHLEQLGQSIAVFHEPGGDQVAEIIRSILKGQPDDPVVRMLFNGQDYTIEPKTEVFLFNAARVQAMTQVQKLRKQYNWVIGDRSWISTLAYQGYGHGLDIDHLRQICRYAIEGTEPDMIILLHADHEQAQRRRNDRGGTDRFESAGDSFHQRLHGGYITEAKLAGHPVVNANQAIEQVAADIWQYIQPLIKGGQ